MQVVVHDGHNVIQDLSFEDSSISIGSRTDCAVYLPDMRVAMQQVILVPLPGGSWLLDPVDLTYRTILNGRLVTQRAELDHGDEVLIADFIIKVFFTHEVGFEIAKPVAMEEVAKIRQYPLPAGSHIRKTGDPYTIPPDAQERLAAFAFGLQQCTTIDKLMGGTLAALLKEFDARMVWMGARRQDYGRLELVEGRTADGTTTQEPPFLERYTYRGLERTQYLVVPRADHEAVQSAMSVPLVTKRGRLGILYVDSKRGGCVYDLGSLDLLCMYGAFVAVQLAALVEEQVQLQEAIAAGELSFVRELQARLDPTNVPQWEQLQFAVYCKPGLDRSGDVYDVMRMPNGLAAFFVGHVTASPTRTALAIVEMRAAFRVGGLHADPPHIILRELNWLLVDPQDPCKANCAVIVTNPKTGAAEYATAGEIGSLIIGQQGEPRDLHDPSVPELGVVKEFGFPSKSMRIASDETLVLYTPGCLTVSDDRGNALWKTRLADGLCDGFGVSASDALDNLLSDLGGYFKHGRQPDDITMVFMHRT